MQGYLDAVDPAQGCTIALGRQAVYVARARFGLHLRLARLAACFDADPSAGPVREYLALCGVGEGTGVEMLVVYARLRALNAWAWDLPFMRGASPKPGPKPAYDYAGREWVWWVHKLASRYGWTRGEIFGLWPEEVACYLQETLVAEFDEADERRSLSELAYKYDKNARTSRFVPLTRPAWMAGIPDEPRKIRMRKDRLPVGVIVDLDKVH